MEKFVFGQNDFGWTGIEWFVLWSHLATKNANLRECYAREQWKVKLDKPAFNRSMGSYQTSRQNAKERNPYSKIHQTLLQLWLL